MFINNPIMRIDTSGLGDEEGCYPAMSESLVAAGRVAWRMSIKEQKEFGGTVEKIDSYPKEKIGMYTFTKSVHVSGRATNY